MTTPKKCDKEQERITDAPTHQMGDDARTTIYPLNFILSTASRPVGNYYITELDVNFLF